MHGVGNTRRSIRAAVALVCTAAGSALLIAAPDAMASGSLDIPSLQVPFKTQMLDVPMTIPASSTLIGETIPLQVDGDSAILKNVIPQIAGAKCSHGGGELWTCTAPAGGWVAGTIELSMFADAVMPKTYLGFLSLEGRTYYVMASSPNDASVGATGGYVFDFTGVTPPPENTPTAPEPKSSTAPGTQPAHSASSAAADRSTTSASSGDAPTSSPLPSMSAMAVAVSPTSSATSPGSPSATHLADEAVSSTKSSSGGLSVLVAAAVALLLVGSVATGLLARRRKAAPAQGVAEDVAENAAGTASADEGRPEAGA